MTDLTAKPNTPSRRTADARREAIITAARRLFAQHGFHGTGMAQIARTSQVLVGQIYRDFASKEDLIAAIVERDMSELLDDPDLTGAIEAGRADQMLVWVRRFIGRGLDDETRSVLADILSEATRNTRIAAILTEAHDRMRLRLTAATMVWSQDADKEAARQQLADLIITAAGAIQHRQIFGLGLDQLWIARMVALIDEEIENLSQSVLPA